MFLFPLLLLLLLLLLLPEYCHDVDRVTLTMHCQRCLGCTWQVREIGICNLLTDHAVHCLPLCDWRRVWSCLRTMFIMTRLEMTDDFCNLPSFTTNAWLILLSFPSYLQNWKWLLMRPRVHTNGKGTQVRHPLDLTDWPDLKTAWSNVSHHELILTNYLICLMYCRCTSWCQCWWFWWLGSAWEVPK